MAEVPESGARASGADEAPVGASTVAPEPTDRDATPSLATLFDLLIAPQPDERVPSVGAHRTSF